MDKVDLFSKEYLEHVRKMRTKFFQTGSAYGIDGVRADILACWESAYLINQKHGYPKLDHQKKGRVSATEFQIALNQSADLVAVAEPYMHRLHSFLDKDHFWVTLMDSNGIILKMVGSEKMIQEAHTTDLYEGSYRGNEAPYPGLFYACWQLDRPFQIVSTEHPASIDDNIAGAGTPIHDAETGKCIGVIGISGHWWKSHDHTMGLTIMTAEAISRQLSLLRKNTVIVESNKKLNIALEAVDFGIIYFQEDGTIHEANRHAIEMLCLKQESKENFLKSKKVFDLFSTTISQQNLKKIDQEIDSTGSFSCDAVPAQKYVPLHCTIRQVSEQRAGYFMQLQKVSDLNKMATTRIAAQAPFTFHDIIGESPALMDTINTAETASRHASSVLIIGESGTGKEMFAQAIHNSSSRAAEPFIAINCGAIPKSLIESELFGYEAGAFTGAQRNGHPGKFELANKGTIFLDEIGDMPYETQVVLLRVLQAKEVIRVGGKAPIKIDVRVIAATNQNLEDRIRENTFRRDLYYRLNVLTIQIPALRERIDDITLLSNYFIQKYGHAFDKRVTGISEEALFVLQHHDWPGNVRELENTIERAIIVCSGRILQISDLPENIQKTEHGNTALIETKTVSPLELQISNDFTSATPEIEELKRYLHICDGNLSEVAREMGISRPTVYRKLKKYGIYVKNRYETD